MTDAERLIILRKALIAGDVTVNSRGIGCVHADCYDCTAGAYCISFPASNHDEWLQGSSAFLERVKYRIPSLRTLSERYPEYFI